MLKNVLLWPRPWEYSFDETSKVTWTAILVIPNGANFNHAPFLNITFTKSLNQTITFTNVEVKFKVTNSKKQVIPCEVKLVHYQEDDAATWGQNQVYSLLKQNIS